MDELMSAIQDHSHYDGADASNDTFWERLWDEHGAEYLKTAGHHSFSDFQVWATERGLVPEPYDE